MNSTISSRQLLTLTLVSMLSPFLRLLPGSITAVSGSAAWVSAALAILPASLLVWALSGLGQSVQNGKGLADAVVDALGRFPGSVVLVLWSLWLIFHSGFLLRSGADRFIATIYHGSRPAVFIVLTLLVCVVAAMGTIKPMARVCQIFCPLLLFVIGLVLVFTIQELEPTFLLPITNRQTAQIVRGIPLGVEPVSVVLVNAAFLSKYLDPTAPPKVHRLWLPGICLFGMLFCAVSIGSLGETVTAALPYPFFVMARDLTIVSGVERIEALVVALWLLPDFVLVTVELMVASDNLLLVFGGRKDEKRKNIWLLAGAALIALTAFRIAPNSQSLLEWSDKIIPAIHLGWAYGVIPLLLLISTIRKKF